MILSLYILELLIHINSQILLDVALGIGELLSNRVIIIECVIKDVCS